MDSSAPHDLVPERIYWWARQHALILLIGISAAWLERSGLLLAAMAGASLLAVFRMPQSATSASQPSLWRRTLLFGRIVIALGIIAEPQMDPRAIVITLAVMTILELLEAWRSRKHKKTTPYLALIEQETDALWLISLTFLLAPLTPLGNGIIWLALLRPLGVMASHWTGAPTCPMPWSFSARLVSAVSLLALSAPLPDLFPPELAQGLLAAGATGWIALLGAWALRALKKKGKTPRRF